MKRRTLASVAAALVVVATAGLLQPSPPAEAADAFNPRNYDTAKIMDVIVNPRPDLITIGFHRGAHALLDGSYSGVAENSMKSLELAAKEGFEMVELDVKSTSDRVPILSHDVSLGRETTYAPPGGRPFDPFKAEGDATNELSNPAIATHTWEQLRSSQLRDSISFTPSVETIGTLQDALNYMRDNRIAMVLSLDIRSKEIAQDAWRVISENYDFLGRNYAQSTLFKIPAKEFQTTTDFKNAFGSGFSAINYQPVYNTSDLAPNTFGANKAGEQPVIDHFVSFRGDPSITIAATEVQMKERGGILTGLLAQAQKKFDGRPATASVFSPSVDYYAPGDTNKQDPLLFKTTGYCCQRLTDFLFNKDRRTYPDLPSDSRDERADLTWVIGQGFKSVTTDRAVAFDANLARDGLRNITYMQNNSALPGGDPLPPGTTPGRTSIRAPDPSVIQRDGKFLSVEMRSGAIVGRVADTALGLQDASAFIIWENSSYKQVWAPELVLYGNYFWVYFAAGEGASHRMYAIKSTSFANWANPVPVRMELPDNKWAIDGAPFQWGNDRWFVWSGWEGDTDVEQNLYIAKMTGPETVTGPRYVISKPRETWERVGGGPFVNEGPQPVIDPNGQLHVVYSARHSWQSDYCLADLRLQPGQDITNVWNWYKSNGCLFGSDGGSMQKDWYPTNHSNGPGHHTFALRDGDIRYSPTSAYPATNKFLYHAVPKGMVYKWENRFRYVGSFTWYNNINYTRCCVPGAPASQGFSPMFFENPDYAPKPPPAGPVFETPRTGIKNADPSVIRQGTTYSAVSSNGSSIYLRQAQSIKDLDKAPVIEIWNDANNLGEVWAPELVYWAGRYYIYFSAGRGDAHRMQVISSDTLTGGGFFGTRQQMNLPDRFAVDGMPFSFGGKRYFVWSARPGAANDEQNLYILPMSSPTAVIQSVGEPPVISKPRESWERVTGGNGLPFINEAPQAIRDPSGQLHIAYSANGSWTDQYCIADLRLKVGGDPLKVFDYYKSNGCLFGSNRDTMMTGWDPTKFVNGPGQNSFVLVDGDINTSPPAGQKFPLMYHAVDKGTPYTRANRYWYAGTFAWWGNTTYTRGEGNGPTSNVGWSLKFFEGDGPP